MEFKDHSAKHKDSKKLVDGLVKQLMEAKAKHKEVKKPIKALVGKIKSKRTVTKAEKAAEAARKEAAAAVNQVQHVASAELQQQLDVSQALAAATAAAKTDTS